ncbi:hypothetical protein [Paractinoplanes brasiliensis]|uniref:Uncharacterized protein n=1 Tax=Paractinoplanes brasiliensis TaxID=52695 RepID=A0A4V6PSN2_9ACTN|nr:hypothetical protein [Actinoplanes brasiliensis]TDO31328.1 hypothetical protein C8E87_6743 [Actinoplanes brasiliensis]
MRSRLAVAAATAALTSLVAVFGFGSTAQGATRSPVTFAECVATGGSVFPLGLAGAVCVWMGPNGWVDADSAQISDIHV